MDVKIQFGLVEMKNRMISQSVEYALRAVVYLAHEAPHARTTAQIAREMRVPAAYLYKVLKGLNDAGIVRTKRGNEGGVALLRDPISLTVLDVVNAVEPIKRIDVCPLGLEDHTPRLCPLHKRLDKAIAGLEQAFRETTLAEILADSENGNPLCEAAEAQGQNASPVTTTAEGLC